VGPASLPQPAVSVASVTRRQQLGHGKGHGGGHGNGKGGHRPHG
jgi:hypothetical protein